MDPCHSNSLKLDFVLKSMPLSGMIFNTKPNFTELWWHESNFPLKKYLLVSSPGGELRSHIVSPRVSIAIRGATFSTALRVLDTKGIDVILGMDTLAKWGVRVDCAQRSVHLLASNGQEVTVSATEPSGFLHQMEAIPTDGIRVAPEFPDVFSEDLPEEGRGVDEDLS